MTIRAGAIDSIDIIAANSDPALAKSIDLITAMLLGTLFKPTEIKKRLSIVAIQEVDTEYVQSLISCFNSLLCMQSQDKVSLESL